MCVYMGWYIMELYLNNLEAMKRHKEGTDTAPDTGF